MEFSTARVDEGYRITLPVSICKQIAWITDKAFHNAYLILLNAGRARLVPITEANDETRIQLLRRAGAKVDAPSAALEFEDDRYVGLALRLLPIELKPRDPGWRFVIPKEAATVMDLKAKQSDVALLVVQSYIEIWTISQLRSAVSPPLDELVGELS